MKLDSSFKETGTRDPRGLLYMLGRLELDDPAEIEVFEREIVAPQKITDSLYRVRGADGSVRFEQVEALARWHSREEEAILLRWGTILMLPDLDAAELHLTIVLFSEKTAPTKLRRTFVRRRRSGGVFVRPRYVRMWELDGSRYVALNRPDLLPWITLMRTPREDLELAAWRIVQEGNESLASQFVGLGSVRYNEDELRPLLGRFGPMLTAELMAQTPLGEKVFKLGEEKGKDAGARQEAVRALRAFLRRNFPALADLPEVGRVAGAKDPHAILERLYDAQDESAARAVLNFDIP